MTHRELVRQDLSERKSLVVGAIADPSSLSTAPSGCHLVEIRLDSLGIGQNVHDFAKACPLPLLVTARGLEEGGQSPWSIAERTDAYRALLPHAALIDIELRDFQNFASVIDEAKTLGVTVIGSFHDFEKTPSLEVLSEKMNSHADIHKFALMANSPSDIKTHLNIFEEIPAHNLSVMGMGPLGAAARPLMAEAGSLLNYGFLGETPTAPNQWPADLLKATLEL